MLKNEGSCNDGKVVLMKRYKTSDMESGKDTSVPESRTVRAMSIKCQPLEREKINSTSSSPIKHFTTSKNLESTQRERQKIKGFDKELSEGDKRLKRVKESESRIWLYSRVVREKLDATADSHSDTEEIVFKMGSSFVNEVSISGWMNEFDNEGEVGLEQFLGFPAQLVSYPPDSDAFREFCKAKEAIGGKWGKCSEFAAIVDIKMFFIARVKSKVERKESLLDKVAEEKTELELVLEGLDLNKKKRVDSRTNKFGSAELCQAEQIALKYPKKQMLKALPASGTTGSGEVAKNKRMRVKPSGESGEKVVEGQSATVEDLKKVEERAKLAVLHGEEDTSNIVARLVKGIWLGIKEEKSELKKANIELEKELARSRTDALKEVRQLKASHAVAISQL
ncbi:hypothetical protein GIB67_004821 [Kingdonia uniflora]|uniref:Uncharacterized protein n=1 Tax=Kingdonia uniflora TaxID=39325 RepID=A0A7J7LNM5_9MAGN|nr:hypothetical protein GIB67_004821 [Kingdonia uniflora]